MADKMYWQNVGVSLTARITFEHGDGHLYTVRSESSECPSVHFITLISIHVRWLVRELLF